MISNKKAMSPLAATLVLIVLAVGLGVLIMSLSRGYITDQDVVLEDNGAMSTHKIDSSIKHVEIEKGSLDFEETETGIRVRVVYSEAVTSRSQKVRIVGDLGTEEVVLPAGSIEDGLLVAELPYDKEKVGNILRIE